GRLLPGGAPDAEKTALQPHVSKQWCIPRKPLANSSGEFVWRMEDLLEISTRPYDRRRPLVCLDETSKQLRRGTRPGSLPAPVRPTRMDLRVRTRGRAESVPAL